MLDDDFFDKLTGEEMRELRQKLLTKMIGEPVADPKFNRPDEKLTAIIRQSDEFIDRLRAVVNRWGDFRGRLARIAEIAKADETRAYLKKVRVHAAIEVPSTEDVLREIIYGLSLEGEARERHTMRRTLGVAIRRNAMSLNHFLTTLPMQTSLLDLNALNSQILAAQIWAFVQEMMARVSAGTQHVFRKHEMPGFEGVLSDSVDKTIDAAFHVANVMPIANIIRFIFGYIHNQGQDWIKGQQQKGWTEIELNVFLCAYFESWTEKGGKEEIETVVARAEESVEKSGERIEAIESIAGSIAIMMRNHDEMVQDYNALT